MKIKPIKIILRGQQQVDRAVHILQTIPLEPVMEVTIKPFKDSKSLAQLRTVHMWVKEIQEVFQESRGKFYTLDALKQWLKGLFGITEYLDMPNGTQTLVYKSFADYTVEEMRIFMDTMNNYCGSELRIFLTIPNLNEQ